MIKCYCPDFLYGIIRLTVNRALSKLNSSLNHTDKITIMLADDHPLLRQALRNLLEKQPDFEIVAEVADGEEAVRLANELIPDVPRAYSGRRFLMLYAECLLERWCYLQRFHSRCSNMLFGTK